MKTVLLFYFILLASITGWSQSRITGTVYNQNQEPLAGAAIVVKDTYKGTFSDANGKYELRNLQRGLIYLKVSYLGYETFLDSVKIVSGEDAQLDFVLAQSSFVSDEVVISATRAGELTPTTYTNLGGQAIEEANFGQDLPYLLQFTPSTVVTSDAGAGIGYSGVRIRGSDQTRINTTVNGIPLNDPESHGVFWVNMPDFASSAEHIQIQRGVGTSTNGAAAFGASMNIQTNMLNEKAYAELDNSFGSFNTFRNTVKAGTGLIDNQFSVDARLSRLTSDGYIDRASSDLQAYYLAGAWHGENSLLRLNVFGGHETTYQAWNGISQDQLKEDRTFNSAGMYQEDNGIIRFYDREVDNYDQHHYHLHFTHRFSNRLNLNISGHYTRGYGYYEQFREDEDFDTYQLDTLFHGGQYINTSGLDSIVVDGNTINTTGIDQLFVGADTITTTDLIRRRWLDNHFYGGIFSVNYNNEKGFKLTIGGAMNQYVGDHYGEIIWAEYASQSQIRDRYYENTAIKTEASAYTKATYQLGPASVFGDMQYRTVSYTFEGLNVVNEETIVTDQTVDFHFFNPKAGVMFDLNDRNNLYASFAVAHREPVRDDFTESSPLSRPVPEQLRNLELGYRHKGKRLFLNANYYLMDYKDQLVLTGEINDVGAYTRVNIPKSYRTGIEIEGGYRIFNRLHVAANATLSQNKIVQFTEYIDDYDTWEQVAVTHSNTDIAFSPSIIAGGQILWEPINNLLLNLMPKYVGEQFLDNTSSRDKMLNAYFLTNLSARYTIEDVVFREITVGVLVYNLFDQLYESNGYTFSGFSGGELYHYNYYYPQAGRNFLVSLTLKI